jgi:hypothetical protein
MPSKHILVSTVLATLIGVVVVSAPAPSSGQGKPLPPGHPPLGGPGSSGQVPAPPPGSGTQGQALNWTPPHGWTVETPSSAMRRAQYRIPGAAGAGECVVFYFGPGEGGDAQANAARWASQFKRSDGKPIGDAYKTREIKVGDIPVLMVEVVGTYVGGMGGAPSGPERPSQMLLGAIAKGPDANWFFRAIGPKATMEAQRSAFEGMIRSLKRGQSL